MPYMLLHSTARRRPASIVGLVVACLLTASAATLHASTVPHVDLPLVPTSVKPGSAGFTLTVNGSGFTANSVVNWNGNPRVTTFVSNSQVTATIGASDVAVAGTGSVSVSNSVLGGAASNVAFFQVTNHEPAVGLGIKGTCTLAPAASADFNGDGKLDLAVLNLSRNNSLSIMLGDGDGTFRNHASYSTSNTPTAAAWGDFNGDGKIDLAIASSAGNGVDVYLGKGDGTFQPRQTFKTGHQPLALATGDFNEDGSLDLAVANASDDTVSILLGKGDGSFQNHVDFPAGPSPASVVVADFNNDGHLDLAVGNALTGQTVSTLLGNGDGTFEAPIATLIQDGDPGDLAVADLNGDGKLDLAVASGAGKSVYVLLGNGDGTFAIPVAYAIPGYSVSIAIGDFNGDGRLDLAVNGNNDIGSTSTSILIGKGDGTFGSATSYTSGITRGAIFSGDYNGDGRLDVENGCALLQMSRAVSFNRVTLVFSAQVVGTTSPAKQVRLTNSGSQPVTLSNLNTTGDFSQSNDCPATLGILKGCTINVRFSPSGLGTRNGTLTVTDNAANSPQTIPLTGTGTQ